MNNKLSTALVVAAVCGLAFSEEQTSGSMSSRNPVHIEWTERPNTQKGKIVFADTQDIPLQDSITNMIKMLTRRYRYDIRYVKCPPKEVTKLKSDFDANVLIAVVHNDETPTALIALEDHWGVVNVAKIAATLKTQKARDEYLQDRCKKEILRVFSIVCGGGASQYPGNIFNCARLDMLDYTNGLYPIDMQKKYHDYLGEIGVSPKVVVSYERACREGWAPQPTNEYQKAIWEKVHQIPDKPITIEYDPKKDK